MFLDRNKTENHLISSLKETLLENGGCLISDKNLFLTVDQWQVLNHEAHNLNYKKNTNLQETPHLLKVSTIKTSKVGTILNKVIYDVLNSVQLRSLIFEITGLHHFNIDQCEAHLYEKGDFSSSRWNRDNFKSYQYIISLFLEGAYRGGEQVISRHGQEKVIYTPQSEEIFIISCDYDHEVKPIIHGNRNLVLGFIQPLAEYF
ncbi:MAG: hypothetical protein JSR85_07940 [Proteobacteria bacterium]|nr:hypothetical protein [Pseudomonadota bacterium]